MKDLKVGIQLFSVRDEMAKDMDKTLGKLKEIGYDYVEFAGFFGKPAEEVKDILAKHDVTAISVHQNAVPYMEKDSAKAMIKYLQTLGIKRNVLPWYERTLFRGEEMAKTIKLFNDLAKLLNDNGIELGYHNHDFEFDKFGDKYILDYLYENVPALRAELDLCWVNYGGEDPVKYVKKYGNRSSLVHFKDFFAKGNKTTVYALIDENGKEIKKEANQADNQFRFMPLGQGLQNWAPIVDAVRESDIEYVIYEKDEWYDGDAIEDAAISREFLKKNFNI